LIENHVYTDDFKFAYGSNTDFDALVKDLKTRKDNYDKQVKSDHQALLASGGMTAMAMPVATRPGDATHLYTSTERNNAITYAKKWTSEGSGNSTTPYNNAQFKNYSPDDCQNYVSQAIWYGFAKTKLASPQSSTKDFPMSGTWWADTSNTATTWNWTGTSYFHDWITSNQSTSNYGIQGSSSTTPTGIQVGDYIYVPGHVMFVSKVTDSNANGIVEWSEIYVSAHTNNHLDYNLKTLYGTSTPPANMEFMSIYGYKYNTDMYSGWHMV
jgi:hypothetical protein